MSDSGKPASMDPLLEEKGTQLLLQEEAYMVQEETRETVVLHLAEVGMVLPADTNLISSLSAQHPLVPFPNPGNA